MQGGNFIVDPDNFVLNDDLDLAAVIRHMPDSIFISDADGRILAMNPAAQHLLGLSVRGNAELYVQHLLEKGVYEPSTAMEAARSKSIVVGMVHANDGDIMAISKPVLDKKGNVLMVITGSRSKELIDEFLATALQEERLKTDRYRQATRMVGASRSAKPVASSPAMRKIMRLANSVACKDAAVLLTGESGAGKDVMAMYIHQVSGRSEEPFIPVNCGAIPPDLMETEFFGYVRGAFTGASPQGKAGFFEMAHQGTLFLDEIGEMPLIMQAKLLRCLETGEVRRVGDTRRHVMNVRIIAATNKNLHTLAKEGLFRQDLYYRLNVIPLAIPPLRERKEDIIALAERFLTDCNRRYNQCKRLTPGALEVLMNYKWPGNVRELRNVVERLATFPHYDEIKASFCQSMLVTPEEFQEETPRVSLSLKNYRCRQEEQYILDALRLSSNNVQKASDILGLHKTALYRKLRSMGWKGSICGKKSTDVS